MSKKQIAKRLLQIVIVLLGISFITFGLTFMSPGDPVRNMYTATGVMPSEEMIQETREEMGLNDPFLQQYTRWLGNCLKGDFGKSYSLNRPVTELLAERLWPTLKLTIDVYGHDVDSVRATWECYLHSIKINGLIILSVELHFWGALCQTFG